MKKQVLAAIRRSIQAGYLPENWNEQRHSGDRLVPVGIGPHFDDDRNRTPSQDAYFMLLIDAVEVGGNYYRPNIDTDIYLDELTDDWVLYCETVHAYAIINGYSQQIRTLEGNSIYYEGRRYVIRDLAAFDLEIDDFGDAVAIRSDDDNQDYDDDSEEEYSSDDYMFDIYGYHSGPAHFDKRADSTVFSVGFEVEKNGRPAADVKARDIYNATGWKVERDSSVSNGFELVSPIFDLYDNSTIRHDIAQLEYLINVPEIDNAGGHIHIGMKGKTDEQFYDLLTPWMPFIFALYHYRLNNSYCSGKRPAYMRVNKSKYHAVQFHRNHIELRIIGPVSNAKQLLFRIELLQYICRHLNVSHSDILRLLAKRNSELSRLLRKAYGNDDKRRQDLIQRFVKMCDFCDFKLMKKTREKYAQTEPQPETTFSPF